jgi:multiple sugar transport system permease protein
MAQATAPPEGKRNRRSVGQIARLALSYAALLFLTLIFVAPLLWMLSTSFKTNVEATTLPLNFLPNEPSTYGYDTILNSAGTPVLRWFVNSMVAAAAHAVLVLATAAPAAYALARMEFRGKRIFFAAIIGTLFIPQFLFLVPNYAIVDTFGWLDTLLAIIVPGAAGAFGVFFLRQFFLALPEELEEAALLDGANRFQIFARIVLPLSKPALATLALLSFLTNYNDFLWPIYVLFNPESLTLPPGLALLGFSYQTDYAVIMAGGVIASIPVLIVFLIAQRYVIEGIARSGIKG